MNLERIVRQGKNEKLVETEIGKPICVLCGVESVTAC
jgi:hypothetical protein